MCTKLAQLKSQQIITLAKLPTKAIPETYMPQYPLCLSHTHNINHLFNCSQVPPVAQPEITKGGWQLK